jgi:hypothetical protein
VRVFEREWVDMIRQQYARVPDRAKHPLCLIATKDECVGWRDEIEAMVADLVDPAQQPDLIARLRAEPNFEDAYNELLVGRLLQERG